VDDITRSANRKDALFYVRLRLTLNADCPNISKASTTSGLFWGFRFCFGFGFVPICFRTSRMIYPWRQLQLIAPTVARRLSVVKCLPLDYYGFLRPLLCRSAASAVPRIWQRLASVPKYQGSACGEFSTSVRGRTQHGCSLCGERKRSETGNNGWQEVRTTDYGIPAPRRD